HESGASGRNRLLVGKSFRILRLTRLVAERDRETETDAVARIVVSKQLAQRIAQSATNDGRDFGTAQTRSVRLHSADAILRVAATHDEVGQQLVFRVLESDITVLLLQCKLAQFGTAFQCILDRFFKRHSVTRIRLTQRIYGTELRQDERRVAKICNEFLDAVLSLIGGKCRR